MKSFNPLTKMEIKFDYTRIFTIQHQVHLFVDIDDKLRLSLPKNFFCKIMSLEDDELCVGSIWLSKEEASCAVEKYSIEQGF